MNLPANADGTDTLRTSIPHTSWQLIVCATTTKACMP